MGLWEFHLVLAELCVSENAPLLPRLMDCRPPLLLEAMLFFYCKCLESASILYAPHNLLYVQCQHIVPMQGQVCPLRGQDDGWACLTFMQEVKVCVMTLSLVFNNFISHNHNQTPSVPISSHAGIVECRNCYKLWQWTYILA